MRHLPPCMKILLLGSTGLVGSAISSVGRGLGHEMITPSHTECDITNPASVQACVQKHHPEIILNATGYTKVDNAESRPDDAFAINQIGVRHIVDAIQKMNITLIHFSTDYVFDGTKESGYAESDAPAPLSIYGKSKLESEKEITSRLSCYFLIRTSWVFGPGGKNFVDTMLGLAEKGQPEIRVVNDQYGCPTYTPDLAKAVFDLLPTQKYGIYHLVNSESTSWYEFAREIFHELGVPQKIIPISSEELKRPAKRPTHSVLRNTKTPPLRPWKEALADYLMNKEIIL